MIKILSSLFITGVVLGYGPCLVSCGPMLVSYIAATKESAKGGLRTYLIFSLTRLVVYAVFGIVAGTIGEWVLHAFFESRALELIFVIFGIFLGLCGLMLIIEKFSFGKKCPSFMHKYLEPTSVKNVIIFGLIVSLAPCLPLAAVVGYIVLISDVWYKGVFYMLAFGLGTVVSPMIILAVLAGSFGRFLKDHQKAVRFVKVICGIILFLLGINLILATPQVILPRF